jgi:flagellar basal body rod protein FlgG
MSSISSIALSGINVAQQRLQAAANNIANAATPGYQRQRVESVAGPGGVSAVITREAESRPGLYVEDAVEVLAATQAFEANLLVIRAEDRMLGSLFDAFA